ncbi:hypothetical protein U5N22_08540 [Bacillus safensis]|uniref:hypothetical protein n=1 Tax=Bacillus safensis TaxID=561879 RepID=UPI003978BEC4
MKIGHLTFGTPEYVRVTKMAEREGEEKAEMEANDKWFTLLEYATPTERDSLFKILEEIESLLY